MVTILRELKKVSWGESVLRGRYRDVHGSVGQTINLPSHRLFFFPHQPPSIATQASLPFLIGRGETSSFQNEMPIGAVMERVSEATIQLPRERGNDAEIDEQVLYRRGGC
jgi:hypothetical protein